MKNSLPLVNLSLLSPFATELRNRGLDAEPVFESVGLNEAATLDPNLSVHATVVYQFLEHAAKSADDPFLAARLGAKLEIAGWPMIADAEKRAVTVGDYLAIFIAGANKVASSAVEYLNIVGPTATFGEKRAFEPTIVPAQNDAFMAGLGIGVLRRAMRNRLDPSKLTIVICDPKTLPPEFALMHPMKGDRLGFRIRFPTSWLSASFESGGKIQGSLEPSGAGANGFVLSLRQMLRSHIGHGSLTANDCARLASLSQQKLKRRLAALGTDISSEIDFVRQEYALRELAETDRPIGDIAEALGFSDPANFARSFRRIHGMPPTRYRTANRNRREY